MAELRGSVAEAEAAGDLSERKALIIMKANDLVELRRELLLSIPKFRERFPLNEIIGNITVQRDLFREFLPLASAAQEVDEAIPGDGINPDIDASLGRVVGVELAENFLEYILATVFGISEALEARREIGKNFGAILFVERREIGRSTKGWRLDVRRYNRPPPGG